VRILIADDDPNILGPLEIALKREGHEVMAAADGKRAWELFTKDRPDFAVLDVSMPGMDGLAVTRRIVESGEPHVPIILLTGRGQVSDKVTALDLGADDYLVKPCSDRELTARIRAVWRRTNVPAKLISAGDLAISPATHEFYLSGTRIEVTANEFAILSALIERAGHVVRYSAMMHKVWGYTVSHDLLRVSVYRLRHKIEPDPGKPRYIHTVPSVGFLVHASNEAAPPQAAAGTKA
jgi:DNA-binding response OmpR family regulator